ncbi:curli assembly protein CsgF [Mesorhizobium sp. KR1-2]|uniref:curli assembly protein CsgF n=1 Tax=Mesorhizobium sp. KR1-2 TaxID=3156609 RepID=UPI0032B5A2D7
MRKILIVLSALSAASLVLPASADDLVYRPINPSFGGNPLNSPHLLGLANAQRDATARDAKKNNDGGSGTGGGTGGTESDVDLFIRQLQGRLLSALASQVTDAIFGQNPQDHGTITFGGTTVEFERSLDSITLVITDANGTVTKIVVPQLVTSNNSTPNALASSLALGNQATLSGSLVGSNSLNTTPLSQSLSTPLN